MTTQIYSDDIGSISLSGSIVRIDLMGQSASDPAGKLKLVVQQQLVMPIDAFLRAAARIQGAVQGMEKKGLIARKAGPVAREARPDAKGVVAGTVGKGGKLPG